MTGEKGNNRVVVDLAALRENYRNLTAFIKDSARILAVVKSDAYGHGLVRVAQCLQEEGVEVFGVAEVDEGVALRQAGITGEIIVLLGVMPDEYHDVVQHRLSPVVFDRGTLITLSDYAGEHDWVVPIHLKIDTGMGRLGIMPHELDMYLSFIQAMTGIHLVGLLSHFPMADAPEREATDLQNRHFASLAAKNRLLFPGVRLHAANSAGLINHPASHYDLVRPGITLYGCSPCPEKQGDGQPLLQPVMAFHSRVVQVKEVPAGYGISYGHLFKTERVTRLAVLPVGYDDGYLRKLTGRAHVLIHGQRVSIVGRICMNACMADVTDLAWVEVGDDVVLMGRQGDGIITAEEIAGWMDTIHYEVLCLFGSMNRRTYLDGSA
ncbi:MAG: alanine racemase [Proteobacteria bacterium]|nr:alanine racemase [Pseudomonadota bacterium]MBU1688713.1 alanine racemase [Pseudomonadota bacterium]